MFQVVKVTQNCSLIFILVLLSTWFLSSTYYEFQWHRMYCAKPISKGVMFTSLEPILDLGVAHGVVFFSSLVFVILSFMHFLAIGMVFFFSLASVILYFMHFLTIGMVSFLSFFFIIPSPKYVGDLGSSSLLLAILFTSIS